ncbi:hypothetical protein [Salinicoccus sp. HZC-1]|uniref:hypothetical protein n=1 Tax=Salinicoccus sp. HZC-1 TaxID=3385497 RepID=UPI00398B3FAE
MESKEIENYFKADNAEELLQALKNKESYIIIRGDFKKDFEKNTQLPLTDTEEMSFELGFRGTGRIWSEAFYQLINVFGKGNKQQKKIDSKVRNYNFKELNRNELLLYLKQLDY